MQAQVFGLNSGMLRNGKSTRLWRPVLRMSGVGFLWVLLTPVWSAAQTGATTPAPSRSSGLAAAEVIKPVTVDVIVGQSAVVTTTLGTLQPPVVANSKICNATGIGSVSILINGLVLGTTQVSVASQDKPANVTTYIVRVVRDATYFAELVKFINAKVPNCRITLTLSPDTSKVLLAGYVWTEEAIRQIYELLDSPDLPRSSIINQLYWACPPVSASGYQAG
jgi:Flp pilus assembly secretin CpaC